MLRGAAEVARRARFGPRDGAELHPALVNGAAGAIVTVRGRPFTVIAFGISGGKIIEIGAIGDPERVARLTAAALGAG